MSTWTLLRTIAVTASCAACAASIDVDRFQYDPLAGGPQDPAAAAFSDLNLTFRSMLPHIDQYFELRLLDRDSAVQAKVVLDQVVRPDFAVQLTGFVPKLNPPYRLDFWSDQNGGTTYSGNTGRSDLKDHGWRRRLEDPTSPEPRPVRPSVVPFEQGKFDFVFLHDTNFTDLFTDPDGKPVSFEDVLLDFDPTLVGIGANAGKTIEVRVTDVTSGRLLGVHRKGRAEASYHPRLSGLLDAATSYAVQIYVDTDGNDRHETGEPSWSLSLVSTGAGIVDTIDLASLPMKPIGAAVVAP